MSKLMDELVEIGAEALANNYCGEDKRKAARHVLSAILPVLGQRMFNPSEALMEAGHEAVSACYSLEPGEGFDEPPGPAAYLTMVDGFFEFELGIDIPDPAPDRDLR